MKRWAPKRRAVSLRVQPILPLLDHTLDAPTVLTPRELIEAVRAQRGRDNEAIPPVCYRRT